MYYLNSPDTTVFLGGFFVQYLCHNRLQYVGRAYAGVICPWTTHGDLYREIAVAHLSSQRGHVTSGVTAEKKRFP